MTLSIQRNVSLKAFNSFGLAATANYFVEVQSLDDLHTLYQDKQLMSLPRLILGAGTNIVLTQDWPGLVLYVQLKGRAVVPSDPHYVLIDVAAGESWHDIVAWTLEQNYAGLENLGLIPGTVGAAPMQNIGAYGLELCERFDHLQAFDFETGLMQRFSLAECGFSYRESYFKKSPPGRWLITSVCLRLPQPWQPNFQYADLKHALKAEPEITAQKIFEAVCQVRRHKLPDPKVVGNVGSFFKNPVVSEQDHASLLASEPQLISYRQAGGQYKLAAAWLIEQCGWKGQCMGLVGVYDKQPLVLVNLSNLSNTTSAESLRACDVINLAQKIQRSVRERFGVVLEIEPRVV